MVGTEFDIDIAFRAGLFVLFQLLRNIVAVLGEDTGYFHILLEEQWSCPESLYGLHREILSG